ncbi:MAG: hypothetical protein ACAH17_01520 [Candidatus Paceibacterota bacterium]
MSKIWETTIKEAFEDANIQATSEQLDTVISWVVGMHENYGTYSGCEHIPNPLYTELDELKKQLKIERSKIQCRNCGGQGRIITQGPYHSGDSECWKCRGEGRVSL